MPTQRKHGGAALQHIPLQVPGFKGLNTEAASGLLGPEWATELKNCAIDGTNRLAGRMGWADQTTTPNGAAFVSGFEFEKANGVTELILTTATTIVRSTDDGGSFAPVTGTASFTDGNWQFLNFADKVVGVQANKAPIVYSGTTFSHIADVNAPQGGAGTSFSGRLWIVAADGHTVKYSALLDETDWTSADSGSWNFQNVWKGTDTVQAIAPHNGALVVFGKRNILFLTDGQGSTLGLDPTQAYVADVISGVGCIARDSVQAIDGDLWFLSESGLQSLGRLIQERSNPLDNLSKNVRSELMDDINNPSFDLADLRSVYSPKDRFYLLSLPQASGSTEVGRAWVFDTRGRLEDRSARCMGQWTGIVPQVPIKRANQDILASSRDYTGELFKYSNFTDNGLSYSFIYRSGWTDLQAPGIKKIFKRFSGIFFANTAITVNFKWAFDFQETFSTRSKVFSGADTGGQWDVGLWDTAVWGGGTQLREGRVVPAGQGEYIKWGVDATIDGAEFSIQQLELFAKLGRLG